MQEPPRKRRSTWLSVVTLLFGAVALGLAAIPPIALGRPLGLLPEKEAKVVPPELRHEGGIRLAVGKFSVTFGGKEVAEPAPPPPPPLQNPLKWFLVTMIGCALVGLVLGPIAWSRERHFVISGTGMALATAAVIWQYIIIGVVVAVAIVVILALVSAFS